MFSLFYFINVSLIKKKKEEEGVGLISVWFERENISESLFGACIVVSVWSVSEFCVLCLDPKPNWGIELKREWDPPDPPAATAIN